MTVWVGMGIIKETTGDHPTREALTSCAWFLVSSRVARRKTNAYLQRNLEGRKG